MNIRWKTLGALFAVILVVMSVLYVVTQDITFNGIAASERQDAEQNAQRFVSNLNIDLAHLNSTIYDWSVWDDTYNFVQDNNTAYIESNLLDQTFTSLNLNIMLYFNISRQLVFGKVFDLSNETDVPLQSNIVSQISSDDFLFTKDNSNGVAGLVLIGNHPALIAANPILTSLGEGPSHGTIIIVRYFDTSELSLLTDAVGLPISTVNLNQPEIPPDFQAAMTSLSPYRRVFANPLNSTCVSAYILLQDLSGSPILISRVDSYRSAFVQGQNSMLYAFVSLLIMGMIIFLTMAFLLEKVVISRINNLEGAVVRIRKEGDDSGRIAVKGRDELSSLGKSINSMLDAIKESRLELKQAENRYHSLFDEAPLGILLINPDTMMATEFNEKASNQLGYNAKEFAKLRISDYQAAETYQEIGTRVEKITKEGKDHFETKHRSKDGELHDVMVDVRTIELSGRKLMLCTYHDITDIKRVETALMDSEEKYRLLIELAQEGVWALNSDYETVFVNPRMQQMLGYSESEMIGKNLLYFIDKSEIEVVRTSLASKKDINGHFEFRFRRSDGSQIFVSIAASTMKDDDGNKIGNLALVADVTEQEKMKQKLEKYSENLEALVAQRTAQLEKAQRLAAIGELAGMVGHDLRNPLTGIKNAAYFLRKKNGSIIDASGKEMLAVIDNSIERANKIISDLLDYSRNIHIEILDCNPKRLLDDALSAVSVPDRIRLTNETTQEPSMIADRDKIERVFVNIIKNAVDAMPKKGTLKICSRQEGEFVVFKFEDSGDGIPQEAMDKIFTPLFTTKAQGMGFGLAICKRIVDAHGGKIFVESSLGKGTTFTVIIPVIQKPSSEEWDASVLPPVVAVTSSSKRE